VHATDIRNYADDGTCQRHYVLHYHIPRSLTDERPPPHHSVNLLNTITTPSAMHRSILQATGARALNILNRRAQSLSLKNGRFKPPKLWGLIFIGYQPLTNNTAKTCFGEKNMVKIRPAVAEQSRRKKKTQNHPIYCAIKWPLTYKTSPSLAASGVV